MAPDQMGMAPGVADDPNDPNARWKLLQANFQRAGLIPQQSGAYPLAPLPDQSITQPAGPQAVQLFNGQAQQPMPAIPAPMSPLQAEKPVVPYTWVQGLADAVDTWNSAQKRKRNGFDFPNAWPFSDTGGGNAGPMSDGTIGGF